MKNILLILILFSQTAFSQKGIFSTIECDLPSINLNNSSVVTQQLRYGLGYSFDENIGASLNIGSGLMGNNSIPSFGTKEYYSYGISASYMFLNLKNNYKIGVEFLSDYNLFFVDKNNNHFSVTSALKLQFPSKTFLKIGLQNRFMANNATLLICTFGFKIK